MSSKNLSRRAVPYSYNPPNNINYYTNADIHFLWIDAHYKDAIFYKDSKTDSNISIKLGKNSHKV